MPTVQDAQVQVTTRLGEAQMQMTIREMVPSQPVLPQPISTVSSKVRGHGRGRGILRMQAEQGSAPGSREPAVPALNGQAVPGAQLLKSDLAVRPSLQLAVLALKGEPMWPDHEEASERPEKVVNLRREFNGQMVQFRDQRQPTNAPNLPVCLHPGLGPARASDRSLEE